MTEQKGHFSRILVGVDLSDGQRFVGEQISDSTRQAIERAAWFAKAESAELFLLYVLSPAAQRLSYDRQTLLAEAEDYKTVFDDACETLKAIASSTACLGVKTGSKVLYGISWIETIRYVLRTHPDLVVVGTRKKGAFRSMVFGHTGLKLLRKCPCPVWVTTAQAEEQIASILVAHDLTAVGETALQWGCTLARDSGSALHVLHAIEPKRPASNPSCTEEMARQRIEQQLAEAGVDPASVQIHLVTETAEHAILAHIDRHGTDLVVMGTIARAGIAGLMVGNTAEKLFPFLPCSLLAVKPAGFVSAVKLIDDEDS